MVAGLVAVGLALAGAASGSPELGEQNGANEGRGRVLAVAVRRLQRARGYDVPRRFVGKVEAERQSALGFELAGRLVAVNVQEGDAVGAGQIVARLDTARLEARRAVLAAQLAAAGARLEELREGPRREVIDAARAELNRAAAAHRLALLNAERTRQLVGADVVSQEEWDNARLTEESRRAEVASASARLDELLAGTRREQIDAQAAVVRQKQAEVDALNVDLAKSVLKAPYAGAVASRYRDEGEVVTAGTAIVELVEMPRLRVRVGLSARAAQRLTPGQTLTVEIRDRTQTATVRAVRPDRNPATRTVTLLAALENPPASIKVGDLASVVLSRREQRDGFWIPLSALAEGQRGLWACYVAAPLKGRTTRTAATHHISSRPVELLYEDARRAFVIGPLEEGELLVTAGLHRLVPEQHVILAGQAVGVRGDAARGGPAR